MKKVLKRIVIGIVGIFLLLMFAQLYYIHSLSADETYPEDTYLASETNKKALIVTAHDDDAYAMSGTVAKLLEAGWTVRHVCFPKGDGVELDELYKGVAKRHGIAGVDFLPTNYRNDLDTNKAAYMPIPLSLFPVVFNHDTVYRALEGFVRGFQPSVIFSLDDSIGGYGHPDHVFISKMVVEYVNHHKEEADFSVKKIYQGVFTPSMSEHIMIKDSRGPIETNPYLNGKRIYGCGALVPNVEVNIYDWAEEKKAYMDGFSERDKRNIRKFSRYYNWYPYWVYFRIFDKEYFRVIGN